MSADFRPPLTWRAAAVSAPYTAGDLAPSYRIDAAGNTHLRGRLNVAPGSSGTPAFVLPPMYRPKTLKRIPVATLPGGTTGRVNVNASGEVIPITSSKKVNVFFLDVTFASAGASSGESEPVVPDDNPSAEPPDALDELDRDLDNLNGVVLPGLQNDLADLNNNVLPQLNADLDNLNNVTLPGVQQDLADLDASLGGLNGLFPITSTSISDGAITTPKMTANSINGDRIVANTLHADKIIGNSITGDKIQANSIAGDRIIANTLSGDRIIGNTISGDKIIANSISGDRIVGSSISGDKIVANSIGVDRLSANVFSAITITANQITGRISTDRLETNANGAISFGSPVVLQGATVLGALLVEAGGIRTSGEVYGGGDVGSGGRVYGAVVSGGSVWTTSPPEVSATANAFIGANGQICKSTSSRRRKTDIEDLGIDVDTLLDLRPRQFRSLSPVEDSDETFTGFIAEEADELGLTPWVGYDEEGRPDSFSYPSWVAALQKIARHQRDQLATQADQIAALTARLDALEDRAA